jgi:F-type H+-transporting ATPase subunit gamma
LPNLKDIQRRIGSVKKTQQITRAMRMVAGAKLRRAQDAITKARPYAERMRDTVAAVAAASHDAEHPLLEARESVATLEVIIVTSDRGLCGGFNSALLKHANRLLAQRDAKVSGIRIVTAGRKAREFFKRRRSEQMADDFPQDGWVTYGGAVDIANGVASRYIEGEIDEAILIYSEFVSPMTQTPRDVRVLPFAVEPEEGEEVEALQYEIEPNPARLLSALIPKALETEIFRALLENQAGEHAARMAAMESATRNTEELIDRLTLQYNRARQAAITKELMEIVSGAEAL